MPRRLLSLLPAACLAALLTACTGGGVSVTRQEMRVPSLDSHIRMLNSIGEIQAVILANPLAQDPQGQAIREAMTSTSVFPRLRYVPDRPTADAYGYRVVAAFGGWPVGGDNYCRNANLRPRPPEPDITEVTAALCVGTSLLSEAGARTATICDPADPRLTALMNATVRALFVQSSRLGIGVPGIGVGINL